ncbi:MAG: hypothetical protein E4G90_02395 [Gemmatimonadales bacterium]|nr:MAG: hypothetical protein E4G90_02395 [Gemmatimonadales bacterium]
MTGCESFSPSLLSLFKMILNLTSFPRSGNSFFTTTLLAFDRDWQTLDGDILVFQPVRIFAGEQKSLDFPRSEYLFPQQLDANPVERIEDPDNLFLYKRHDHPDDYGGPRIYIVRDGRDVLVSYAMHNLIHREAQARIDVNVEPDHVQILSSMDKDEFLTELERLIQTSAWGEYVTAGVDHPNTVAVIYYEDMLRDPIAAVSSALLKCGYIVDQVREPPSFKELNSELPWFYRKGKSNDYRAWMPHNLLQQFNDIHGAALGKLGYTNITR